MRQRADGSGTADQRREQMLRAALEVIDERGYPETRIADVAERAGTSPALVIYYFKTKNQLLTEAIRFSEDRWYETGTSRIAAIDTAAGRLEELVAMTCLPEADICHLPGGKSRSLFTVYLIAPCSRPTWAFSAAICADWAFTCCWSCWFCALSSS